MDYLQLFSSTISKNKVYELGHPLHPEIPHHTAHAPFSYSLSRMHGDMNYENGVCTANDLITTGTHTGTHIDAIGHVSCHGMLYEEVPVEGNQSKTKGLNVHSIDQKEPILCRGVLLDIPKIKGLSALDEGYHITKKDIQDVINLQNIKISVGDAVFVRTGWGQFIEQPKKFLAHGKGAPGVSLEAAQYLLQCGMSLTGADNSAYEAPLKNQFPVHKLLLQENGINIIELMNFEQLSVDNTYEFTFICLPLRIIGGTASPIRPIAIA